MAEGPFRPLVTVDATGSTNTDLVAARASDPQRWPHLSALRARHQQAGKGRAGRSWLTPSDEALTVSIVIEPAPRPVARWSSLTTVTALALVRVLREGGLDAWWKWPNDVVLHGAGADLPGWGTSRKVAGILAEVVPAAPGKASDAVVMGVGVNLTQTTLPVAWATSLALAGYRGTLDDVLVGLGRELADLVATWRAGGFEPLRQEARACCDTLGQVITVGDSLVQAGQAPRSEVLEAVDLDEDARLVVRGETGSRVLASGEVTRLRRVNPE